MTNLINVGNLVIEVGLVFLLLTFISGKGYNHRRSDSMSSTDSGDNLWMRHSHHRLTSTHSNYSLRETVYTRVWKV